MAGEAINALVRYARDALGLSRLVAAVDEPNTRSRRLMEACGFLPLGSAQGPTNELIFYGIELDDGGLSN